MPINLDSLVVVDGERTCPLCRFCQRTEMAKKCACRVKSRHQAGILPRLKANWQNLEQPQPSFCPQSPS